MLTRGAAGPPDVPIPTRLVTSGPLLLSLQYTQVHTHAQEFSSGLYAVLQQQCRIKSLTRELTQHFFFLPLPLF